MSLNLIWSGMMAAEKNICKRKISFDVLDKMSKMVG